MTPRCETTRCTWPINMDTHYAVSLASANTLTYAVHGGCCRDRPWRKRDTPTLVNASVMSAAAFLADHARFRAWYNTDAPDV